MKKIYLILIIAASICLTGCSNSDEPDGGGMERPELTVEEAQATSELNQFSVDFIEAVAENAGKDKNFVVSPLSMSMMLAMIANSSDSENICNALHCNDLASLNSISAKYMRWLPNNDKKLKINIANALWYDDDYTVSPAFASVAQDVFSCDIFARDFSNPGLKNEINRWAEKNTNGMIKKLKDEDPEKLFIANALYFKGDWADPFDKKNTEKSKFYGVNGTADIDMMKGTFEAHYFETDEAQVVRLYFTKSFNATIILPKETENIDVFAKEKFGEHWEYMNSGNFYNCEVDLSFPKFELSPDKIEMEKVLSILGLGGLKAGFLKEELLPISLFQIGTVRFDENGAEAAVITGGDTMAVMPPEKKAVMTVDRPFLFLISENSTGLCLFAGQVVHLGK